MGTYLKTEVAEKTPPGVLLYGIHPLIPYLSQLLSSQFSVFLYQNAQAEQVQNALKQFKNLSRAELSTQHIDYSVLFLGSKEDTKEIMPVIEGLIAQKSKTLMVVGVKEIKNHLAILSLCKKYDTLQCLVLGELFGKHIPQSYSIVSTFIHSAIVNQRITLTGDDLFPIYPVSDEDGIKGIFQLLFGGHKKQKVYYLFYDHPQTYISLVHLLKKVDLNIQILYSEEKPFNQTPEPWESIRTLLTAHLDLSLELLHTQLLGFEKSIAQMSTPDTSPQSFAPKPLFSSARTPKESPVPKKQYVFTLGIIMALYTMTILLCFFASIVFFQATMKEFKKGNIEKTHISLKTSQLLVSAVDPPITMLLSSVSFLTGNDEVFGMYRRFKTYIHLMDQTTQGVARLPKESKEISMEHITSGLADINFLYFRIQALLAEEKNQKIVPQGIIGSNTLNLIVLLQMLPELAAYKSEKTYLVVFQNNAELRPTGGFIGSLAELKVSHGKVTHFLLRDVYEADGQLKAHIEPHYVIRRYLQPHLYLRDSNFSPEFQESASQAALLYQLETGADVDGVVAIDSHVFERILEAVGPLTLADYKKTVDKHNVVDFMQHTIESGFFPGSNQKKELLESLFTNLSLKVSNNPHSLYHIFSQLPTLVQEKHILLSSPVSHLQRLFVLTKASGTYQETGEKNNQTVYDFLAFNEANIGSNKANQDVTRKIKYRVVIENEKVTSNATLVLDNQGEKPLPYKTYLRTLLPLGSRLIHIAIDKKKMTVVPAVTDFREFEDKKFTPPEGLEVDTSVGYGRQMFGFITTVLPHTSQTIELTYQSENAIPLSTLQSYNFLYVKQPGTQRSPLDVSVQYPEGFVPKKPYSDSRKNNTLIIQKDISMDEEITVEFLKH